MATKNAVRHLVREAISEVLKECPEDSTVHELEETIEMLEGGDVGGAIAHLRSMVMKMSHAGEGEDMLASLRGPRTDTDIDAY